ncbi:MAG: hypothetical protein ACREUZ_11070 [Burkholderiales bacterium]
MSALTLIHARRHCSFQADERAIACLRQKLGVDQSAEQRVTNVALEAPQALCLRGREAQAGHFDVLTLNPLEHFIDAHWMPPAPADSIACLL